MPVPIAASGTQTCAENTDHTVPGTVITAPTGGAIYQLRVRTTNLAGAQTLSVRLRVMPASGGTTEDDYPAAVFAAGGPDFVKDSPAIALPAGGQISAVLRLEGGATSRDVDWWWLRLDG